MIANIISNNKLSQVVVTEIFVGGRKLNFPALFTTQMYFPKHVRVNCTYFDITKISNKWELYHISINHSSDISSIGFINFYKNCTAKPNSLCVINITLASNNPLSFRKNLLERI